MICLTGFFYVRYMNKSRYNNILIEVLRFYCEVEFALLLRVQTTQLSKAMSTQGTIFGEFEHL